jgi:hypothetical protein
MQFFSSALCSGKNSRCYNGIRLCESALIPLKFQNTYTNWLTYPFANMEVKLCYRLSHWASVMFTATTLTPWCKILIQKLIIFLIDIVGCGVQLGQIGTAATNRPIVPAPGDYDDGEIGEMIGRGNRSTWKKHAPVLLCPPQTPHAART